MSKQFYFINKSETSTHLSRSIAAEKSAVQRHVQTGRKRNRVAKGTKAAAASSSPSSIENHPVASNQSASRTHIGDEIISHLLGRTELTDGTTCASQSRDDFLRDIQEGVLSLANQKILSKQDPFGVTSVPIDRTVAGLLNYYVYYYHPSQWPNEMALLRQGVYVFHGSVLNIMKTAIEDELTMFCLLAAAVCRFQFIDRLPCPQVVGKENTFVQKALRLVASRIASGGFDELQRLRNFLTCVLFLNSAEAYRGDNMAAATHLGAAIRLLRPKGGLAFVRDEMKDEGFMLQLAMADLYLACVNQEVCSFDCPYDPGPASLLRLSDTEMRTSGATSTALSLLKRRDAAIPSELQIIIKDLTDSHAVKCQISTSSMTSERATQVLHWITRRNMAVRHRLLALKTTDQRIHSLRMAIIMWTLLTMNVTGRAKTVKIMAPKLKVSLSEVSPTSWIQFEDVKLWMMLIGLHCIGSESEAAAWFIHHIRDLSRKFLCVDAATTGSPSLTEQLEIFQCGFFFDVPTQRARTRNVAEILQHALTTPTT